MDEELKASEMAKIVDMAPNVLTNRANDFCCKLIFPLGLISPPCFPFCLLENELRLVVMIIMIIFNIDMIFCFPSKMKEDTLEFCTMPRMSKY